MTNADAEKLFSTTAFSFGCSGRHLPCSLKVGAALFGPVWLQFGYATVNSMSALTFQSAHAFNEQTNILFLPFGSRI
jgi:hypothetical protein